MANLVNHAKWKPLWYLTTCTIYPNLRVRLLIRRQRATMESLFKEHNAMHFRLVVINKIYFGKYKSRSRQIKSCSHKRFKRVVYIVPPMTVAFSNKKKMSPCHLRASVRQRPSHTKYVCASSGVASYVKYM